MVEAANNALLAVNAVRTTFGELLRYIVMMLLMSCYMKSRLLLENGGKDG